MQSASATSVGNIVCLQDSESAQKAVEELNGTEMFGKTLYVSRL